MPCGFCGAAGSNALTQVTLPSPASATSPPASWISNANVDPIGSGVRLAMKTPPRVTFGRELVDEGVERREAESDADRGLRAHEGYRVSADPAVRGKPNSRRVFAESRVDLGRGRFRAAPRARPVSSAM
jgi:hypothetical protein